MEKEKGKIVLELYANSASQEYEIRREEWSNEKWKDAIKWMDWHWNDTPMRPIEMAEQHHPYYNCIDDPYYPWKNKDEEKNDKKEHNDWLDTYMHSSKLKSMHLGEIVVFGKGKDSNLIYNIANDKVFRANSFTTNKVYGFLEMPLNEIYQDKIGKEILDKLFLYA
ncbi:MAG: hypothetical protein QXS81_03855 [Candidatus Micrarchaeaceae archaeon]